jgi:hypothetical protein
MKRMWLLRGLKILVIVAVALAAFGAVVMLLWNALLPQIFGLHDISFPQALGLLLLVRILVGTLRGGGHHRHRWHRRHRDWQGWHRMAPEERERFKAQMRERFRHAGGCHEGERRDSGDRHQS